MSAKTECCRGCGDELTAESVFEMDATICEHCHKDECARCGEIEIDTEVVDGDRLCLHCRYGHQRVLWAHTDRGVEYYAVHGPCNCEVRS